MAQRVGTSTGLQNQCSAGSIPAATANGFLIFDCRFLIERRDGEERSFELRFAIVEREDALLTRQRQIGILGFLIFDCRFWIERRDGGERSFELRFAIVERKDAYSRVSAQSQIKNQKSKIAAWCRGCAGRIARLWALRGGFDSRTTPHNRDCRVAEQTEALACKAGSRGCKSRRGIQTAGIRE